MALNKNTGSNGTIEENEDKRKRRIKVQNANAMENLNITAIFLEDIMITDC